MSTREPMLAARRWVQTDVRDVLSDTTTQLIEELQLRSAKPLATVLIQTIDHDLWPYTATIAVDSVARPSSKHLAHDSPRDAPYDGIELAKNSAKSLTSL